LKSSLKCNFAFDLILLQTHTVVTNTSCSQTKYCQYSTSFGKGQSVVLLKNSKKKNVWFRFSLTIEAQRSLSEPQAPTLGSKPTRSPQYGAPIPPELQTWVPEGVQARGSFDWGCIMRLQLRPRLPKPSPFMELEPPLPRSTIASPYPPKNQRNQDPSPQPQVPSSAWPFPILKQQQW
jgi:hypothetical protein